MPEINIQWGWIYSSVLYFWRHTCNLMLLFLTCRVSLIWCSYVVTDRYNYFKNVFQSSVWFLLNEFSILDCTAAKSVDFCQKCQVSQQCMNGMMCCPERKVCVRRRCDDCKTEDSESAKCKPSCPDHSYPKYCTCGNPKFPDQWAPTCDGKI